MQRLKICEFIPPDSKLGVEYPARYKAWQALATNPSNIEMQSHIKRVSRFAVIKDMFKPRLPMSIPIGGLIWKVLPTDGKLGVCWALLPSQPMIIAQIQHDLQIAVLRVIDCTNRTIPLSI